MLDTARQERHAIEVKLRRSTETETDALEQITRYLDGAGLDQGWLVLFDLRKTVDWTDKLFIKSKPHRECIIHIVGC